MEQANRKQAGIPGTTRRSGLITWWISGLIIDVLSWQIDAEMKRFRQRYEN
ncbi:hypothetical protein [Pararcticibacter amylolyticus]|uniref:hypothetical protein n=1 Tax=Pararcticibacter amylolyticus TaxID=2173175 RepID=UPI001304E3BF|nr:hypothetical protein [Pararcticibacter amylolyticus]